MRSPYIAICKRDDAHACKMEESREILCDFEGRRRPVVFTSCGDAKEENERLLAAVKATFSDIAGKEENAYYLQVDSAKHGAIDLMSIGRRVADNEIVYLRYCSVLPVGIALPSLICMVLGPTTSTPSSIIVQSFADYVSDVECRTLKEALDSSTPFTPAVRAELVNIMSVN